MDVAEQGTNVRTRGIVLKACTTFGEKDGTSTKARVPTSCTAPGGRAVTVAFSHRRKLRLRGHQTCPRSPLLESSHVEI